MGHLRRPIETLVDDLKNGRTEPKDLHIAAAELHIEGGKPVYILNSGNRRRWALEQHFLETYGENWRHFDPHIPIDVVALSDIDPRSCTSRNGGSSVEVTYVYNRRQADFDAYKRSVLEQVR